MHSFIDKLRWRYATKKFEPSKKITSEQLEILKEALRLTPSSYGLQPLKYFIVEDPSIREKLKEKSFGQNQITDASHVIVICTNLKVPTTQIDTYVDLIAKERTVTRDSIEGFGDYMKSTLNELNEEEIKAWTTKQAYISLGFLLAACAELGIDSTPMEGFEPDGYDEILNLKDQNLHAVLVCTVGYRHEEDKNQWNPKVRKHHDDLFVKI